MHTEGSSAYNGAFHFNVNPPTFTELEDNLAEGTGRFGFRIVSEITGANPGELGTYSVTGAQRGLGPDRRERGCCSGGKTTLSG